MSLATHHFTAFNQPWSICVLSNKNFVKRFGKGVAGMNLTHKKTIYIKRDSFDREVIAHELSHIYFYYFGVEAVQLKRFQIEELACEIIAVHGHVIHKLTNLLYKSLNKQMRERKKKNDNRNTTIRVEKKRKRYCRSLFRGKL